MSNYNPLLRAQRVNPATEYSALVQHTAAKLTSMLISSRTCLCRCAAALCCIIATASAGQPLPMFSASYILENNFVTGGEASLSLSKKEDHYQLQLKTNPTGVFRLSKKGKIRETAELPSLNPPFLSDKHSYTNYGDKKRSYTSVFNRPQNEATFVRNAKTTRVAIGANAVDRLSLTLSLMQQIRVEPSIKSFSIDTIDDDGTQTFNFTSQGQETLQTGLGTLETTRVERQRANSSRKTITWLAPIGPDALPIPVQIEQHKRGKMTVRMRITDFSTNN